MDFKNIFRIYEEDPAKYGLYELSVRTYTGVKEGLSSSVFVSVRLGHNYDNDPDSKRHIDFVELLSALHDCIGFNYLSGYTTQDSIYIEGWL